MRAMDKQLAQGPQRGGALAEGGKGVLHYTIQKLQLDFCTVHAQQGGVVGFGLRCILAGGLAQLLGTRFHDQNVITHLEGQPQCLGETVQHLQSAFVHGASQCAHAHRGADQRAGFQRVHALQLCQ